MTRLNEKVVLITGASKGIGADVARAAADAGAQVIVNYSSDSTAAAAVVKAITDRGGDAIAIKADVSDPREVMLLFDRSIAHFGRIDILINNAGVVVCKLIKDTTDEDFDRLFDVNVKGTFNTLREAATRLAPNGSVINFSTSVNRMILPTYAIYAASKSAVEQLTRIFAKEVGPRGINVNSLSPGPTNTEFFRIGKTDEQISRIAAFSAFNRIAEPADIVRIALFLASDDAKWISAQNIGANGAMA
jgi:3-oxoacyl-[acyl-carrier protein] reductase